MALAAPVRAQVLVLHATGPLPSYEVATIKPSDGLHSYGPGARNVMRMIGNTKTIIQGAYKISLVSGSRVIGGPSWIDKDLYVIEGKIPDELFARMQTMPIAERQRQTSLLQQSLLAERFQLRIHFEMREMAVYDLVVMKGGAKLSAAKNLPADPNAIPSLPGPPPPPPPPPPGPPRPGPPAPDPSFTEGVMLRRTTQGMEIIAKGMTLDRVLDGPLFGLDRMIVDKTGLTGRYDFTLDWTPDQGMAAGAGNAAPAEGGPSIFTALQEQLGLRLLAAKEQVEVVVIDSIERPSEN